MNHEPVRASEVRAESVDWLWRDRIPRKMMTIVGGRPDQGKGLFCAHVAAETSNMEFKKAGGGKRPGRVLYSAIEDSHALMTRPRLEASGANLDNIDLWRFRLPLHQDQLVARLIREGPYDLLVMDPFASHLSGNISRHSDNVRQVTDPLIEVLEAMGTACIIVEHVLKRVPANSHPIAAIGGTGSGLVAAARMGFLFGINPKDGDQRILACVKHNICEKPQEISFELDTCNIAGVRDEVASLLFDEECNFDPLDFLQYRREGRGGRPPDKRAAACEWLSNYLYEALGHGLPALKGSQKKYSAVVPGPVPAARVFEDGLQFGLSNKTLRRACQDMNILRVPPAGWHTTWMLPDEVIEILDEAHGLVRGRPVQQVPDGELEAAKEPGMPMPSERAGMQDMSAFEAQMADDDKKDNDKKKGKDKKDA
jgi:AAA domain-containing protein